MTITPEAPTSRDDLQVVVTGSSEAVGYTYGWSADGFARDDQFGATLGSRHTTPGAEWSVEVSAVDARGRVGQPVTASVRIVPHVDEVRIVPSLPRPGMVLSLDVVQWAGDTVREVAWYVDGDPVGTAETLDTHGLARGQEVSAEITPSLDDLVGPTVVAEAVTLGNGLPGAPIVAVSPAQPVPGVDDLHCEVLEDSVDPDGDVVVTRVRWMVDGRDHSGAVETGELPWDTVPGSATGAGFVWTCVVVPHDGIEDGYPGVGSVTVGDPCAGLDVEALTEPLYVSFIVHNEEDDAEGVEGSEPGEPDYNGDPAVFDHFADAMWELASSLSEAGATLSFQPDWTFVEGVAAYRPSLLQDMSKLDGVEIAPHAHETYVLYDDLFDRLRAVDASPQRYLGGMDFELYTQRGDWFRLHPDFAFWEAPTVSVDHDDDVVAPGLVYRAALPDDVAVVEDLFVHHVDSPLVVTPAWASVVPGVGTVTPAEWVATRPAGSWLTPVYIRLSTRELLADIDDMRVPEQWRTDEATKTADAVIADAVGMVDGDMAPYLEEGAIAFASVSDIIGWFLAYESCLDLSDGMDLSDYRPPEDTG